MNVFILRESFDRTKYQGSLPKVSTDFDPRLLTTARTLSECHSALDVEQMETELHRDRWELDSGSKI